MKLSFSNIAWAAEQDEIMYTFLQTHGFDGLEIAPTRIFPNDPYVLIIEAQDFKMRLREHYGLEISSMQSILYGRSENLFNSVKESKYMADYIKKAVDFAAALGCGNLVFGCPKNRNMPENADCKSSYAFFNEISDYATECDTTISIEPNPQIYGTNFINTTQQAFDLAKKIQSLKVNVDLGTIIENEESLQTVVDNIILVKHIHISEPHLEKIKERSLHSDLSKLLTNVGYEGYISVEMKYFRDVEIVKRVAYYVKEIFG